MNIVASFIRLTSDRHVQFWQDGLLCPCEEDSTSVHSSALYVPVNDVTVPNLLYSCLHKNASKCHLMQEPVHKQ